MLDKILAAYQNTSESDRLEGSQWYKQANEYCRDLACKYSVPHEVVIGIVAVLSPGIDWDLNLRAAESILDGTITSSAYGINRSKALRILESGQVFPSLSGNKVESFFHAIAGDTQAVTVDRWMLRAIEYHRDSTPSKKQYWELASEFRAAAAVIGLTPRELQAIIWVHVRR